MTKKILLLFISLFALQNISAQSINMLKEWLSNTTHSELSQQAFAKKKLTQKEATEAANLLYAYNKDIMRKTRAEEWEKGIFAYKDYEFKFVNKVFGKKNKDGRSMYISLHGGGGCPASVNDQQWKNQMMLYRLDEGLYVVPRSPTNTWNMWHQEYMDYFLDHLIRAAIVFEDVNPNKVYILGYSAGGDGVYQLGPRMADRWAAASMMAGHPGDASPLNLCNTPFAIYQGDLDIAYDRNQWAKKWETMLDSLQRDNPNEYIHDVHIYPDMPHWMMRRDTIAISWMSQFKRNPLPQKVVWKQDDVLNEYFYWLEVPSTCIKKGQEIIAEYKDNTINILKSDSDIVIINLNDLMVNMDKPVTLLFKGNKIFKGRVRRNILSIWQSIKARGDNNFIFSAQLTIVKGKKVYKK